MSNSDVESDGVTVWVNERSGYCLGRFGRMGIDVHVDPMDNKGTQCAFCTHGPVTALDWDIFKRKMLEVHDVVVDDKYLPDRFVFDLAPPSGA